MAKKAVKRSNTKKSSNSKFAFLRQHSKLSIFVLVIVCSAIFAYVGVILHKAQDSGAASAALPFDLPANTTLKGSSKKVFAHYFTPYPISIDNKASNVDYYTNGYLNPNGESGKHAAYGGFLRDRPLPRSVLTGNWQLEDMKTEVKRATEAGLDGFTVDMLGLSGTHWDRLNLLLQATQQVDSSFKIVLMPDANSSVVNDPAALAASVATLAKSPSVYKLADGRLVVSPFYPEKKGAAYWQSWINTMKTQYGIDVAFVPCFLNYSANAAAFAPFSYGFSNWGNRNPAQNASLATNINDAHTKGKIWMQPVSVQDSRPSQSIYDEANNTDNLRLTWNAAINSNAEWVQIPTWNDYSEGAQVSPSVNNNWGPLDISSYYLTRYKTGAWPALKRDVLYISHRIQPAGAKPTGGQTKLMALRSGSSPARDTVEVLSLLPAAADVTVKVGANTYTYSAPAGLSAKIYPLTTGTVYASLSRNGSKLADVTSPFTVSGSPSVQDLQYRFVGSIRDGKSYAASTPPPTTTPPPTSPPPTTPTPPPVTTPPPNDGTNPPSEITPGTVTAAPIVVTGQTITIAPTNPGDEITVKVNGKEVKDNQVNTSNLPNGLNTVTIEENGQTSTQQIEVKNPMPRAAVNEVKSRPVVYGGGFIAVIAAVGAAVRWAIITRFFF